MWGRHSFCLSGALLFPVASEDCRLGWCEKIHRAPTGSGNSRVVYGFTGDRRILEGEILPSPGLTSAPPHVTVFLPLCILICLLIHLVWSDDNRRHSCPNLISCLRLFHFPNHSWTDREGRQALTPVQGARVGYTEPYRGCKPTGRKTLPLRSAARFCCSFVTGDNFINLGSFQIL